MFNNDTNGIIIDISGQLFNFWLNYQWVMKKRKYKDIDLKLISHFTLYNCQRD